jgi:hypothetical protein
MVGILISLSGSVSAVRQENPSCEQTSPSAQDITLNWTYRGKVISAFPEVYPLIEKEENADIIRVFSLNRSPLCPPGYQRRVEVFYTGGDWMAYGLTYFVTDAPNKGEGVPDEKAAAYFIEALSTPDKENGDLAPEINPLDPKELEEFIVTHFLDEIGNVRPEFIPVH